MSDFNKSCGCSTTTTCPSCCNSSTGPGSTPGPDGNMGPAGPAGPAGPGINQDFDPDQSYYYVAGQLIIYNGELYIVNKDNPQGLPGSSPDYTLLPLNVVPGPTGPQGATGAPGAKTPTDFTPDASSTYVAGQIVYYNGSFWIVNKDQPSGAPGSSPDYTQISPNVQPGPQGPTGPAGVDVPQDFDPGATDSYQPGNLVTYDGKLYVVLRPNPQGYPDSSTDYALVNASFQNGPQGPAGPAGVAMPVEWDVESYNSLKAGQLVYYNNNLYVVTKDNPTGSPDDAPQYYEQVSCNQVPGPTGPTGMGGPSQWDQSGNTQYVPGQLVQFNGQLYVYAVDGNTEGCVSGVTPDLDPCFTPIDVGSASNGPQGVQGPTGPQGDCGCTSDVTSTAVALTQLSILLNQVQTLSDINTANILNLQNQEKTLAGKISDNTTALDDLETQNTTNNDNTSNLQVDNTYCAGTPTQVNSLTNNGVSILGICLIPPCCSTTCSTTVTQGSSTAVGCFFGCTVYRQCYYGTVTNTANMLYATSAYDINISLPTDNGPVTGIIAYGGYATNGSGTQYSLPTDNGSEDLFLQADSAGNLTLSLHGGTFGGFQKYIACEPYYLWVDYITCTTLPTPSDSTQCQLFLGMCLGNYDGPSDIMAGTGNNCTAGATGPTETP